ncbi:MAG: hypothetical protein KTR26_12005 [Flammeovirgaceae bacterium]|nr:hypothetical protein [Flammeovirgaceae bacterium]
MSIKKQKANTPIQKFYMRTREILKNGELIEEACSNYNIQKSDFIRLENWYDDYFFAWSYHIKPDDKRHQRKNLCFKKIVL